MGEEFMSEKSVQLSTYLSYKLEELWNAFWLKIGVSTVIAFPTMIFGVDSLWIVVLFSMTLLDLISGVLRSKVKGQEINSRRLLDSVIKSFLYGLFILASYLVSLLFDGYIHLHSLAVTFLVLVEFVSFLENIMEAGVKLPFGIHDWAQKMLNKFDDPAIINPSKNKK